MKKIAIKVTSLMLCVVMATLCLVACGAKTVSGSVKITDGDVAEETELPFKSVKNAYAFNMMGMTSNEYTLTIEGEKYTFHIVDWGNTDKTSSMYFHRVYDITGAATDKGNGAYSLATPTDVTVTVELGASFKEYADTWGTDGTFTLSNDSDIKIANRVLKNWQTGTATIANDTFSFVAG